MRRIPIGTLVLLAFPGLGLATVTKPVVPVKVVPIPAVVQPVSFAPLTLNPSMSYGSLPSLLTPETGGMAAWGIAPSLPGGVALPAAPAAAVIEARMGRLEEKLTVPLQAAADDKAGPDAGRQAGQDIQKILAGGTVAEAEEDLPPAGPLESLTQEDAAWLRAELTEGPNAVLTEAGFNAFVMGDAAAMDAVLPWLASDRQGLSQALHALYAGLRRVQDGDLPASRRAVLGQTLNDRFSQSLGFLSRSEALNVGQRATIAGVRRLLIANRAALFELTHHRQTLKSLEQLDADARRLIAPPAGETQAQAHPWVIRPPLPVNQRGAAADGEVSIVSKMADWAKTIKEWEFLLDKHLRRYRIAMREPRFSQRIRDAMTRNLQWLLGEYQQKAGRLYSGVERITAYSLLTSFLTPDSLKGKPRRVVWVPDNKNLRLIPQPGGYLVQADFETDIQDAAVLAAVKASIEEYWRGSFEWQGRKLTFKVTVTIRTIAPGQPFSEGSLSIRDNAKWMSQAGPNVFMLGHDLNYATAAHEFGHIMGLADEYRAGFDPDLQASVELQNPASLMSSLAGAVLPRHLKTAFLLLRRRSLAGSSGKP
ncbi:MAG: hypothetical protein HY927_14105 [Elusimicrobia bacterium]|nr:hypothetical protein [Elusimicrobiota bacterium]